MRAKELWARHGNAPRWQGPCSSLRWDLSALRHGGTTQPAVSQTVVQRGRGPADAKGFGSRPPHP